MEFSLSARFSYHASVLVQDRHWVVLVYTNLLCVDDIALWENNRYLPHIVSLKYLYEHCTATTQRISTQKNGKPSKIIHQEELCNDYCPIRVLL